MYIVFNIGIYAYAYGVETLEAYACMFCFAHNGLLGLLGLLVFALSKVLYVMCACAHMCAYIYIAVIIR